MSPMIHRDEGFSCLGCGAEVPPLGRGTCRNHCPICLVSRHVDGVAPGDRASDCGGLMDAVEARADARRGQVLLHRCRTCGLERLNRVAEARVGVSQPDSSDAIFELMRKSAEGRA